MKNYPSQAVSRELANMTANSVKRHHDEISREKPLSKTDTNTLQNWIIVSFIIALAIVVTVVSVVSPSNSY